jgi:hypothetical protein
MASSLVQKLTSYFRGKYANEQLDAIDRFVSDIDSTDHEKVYQWIIENREKMTPIGVADIKKACVALGVGFRNNLFFGEVVPIMCPACENSYKYLQSATEATQLEFHQHARCPQCGMPGHDVFLGLAGKEADAGKTPAWYQRTIEHYRKGGQYGQGGWMRPGPWWNPVEVRQENAQAKRESMARTMANLVDEKRWDSMEGRS